MTVVEHPSRDPVAAGVGAPKVSFETFMQWFTWRQGEHLALIGPTGSGKTTLAISLLPKQPYVCVLATKPRDETMDRLAATGYKIFKRWPMWYMERWPVNYLKRYKRRILWPPSKGLDDTERQRERIHEALSIIYGDGGWAVYTDELWYLVSQLRLDHDVKMFLLQARSLKISFTAATQRPAHIPLEVYDMSSHLFFWRDRDETNLKRIGGISWLDSRNVRTLVANLEKHEFLYIHESGAMLRSIAPKGKAVK